MKKDYAKTADTLIAALGGKDTHMARISVTIH